MVCGDERVGVRVSMCHKLNLYSGILGLCAFVEAFPYDVPEFVPSILMELSTHLNDPQVMWLRLSRNSCD